MKNLWNRKRIKEYKPLREIRLWTSGVAKKMLVYVQSRNSTIEGSNYKTVKC